METQEKSLIENLFLAVSRSVTLKLISIFVLMLLLMIPMTFIMNLINERQALRESAIQEVSSIWAGSQVVYGPVLTIPFLRLVNEEGTVKSVREEAHLLPSMLHIDARIEPQILKRGIYEVVVFRSAVSFSGNFGEIEKFTAGPGERKVLWDEAFLTIHVSDLRGIKEKMVVRWQEQDFPVEPGTRIPGIVGSGVTVDGVFAESTDYDISAFSFDLQLQGSGHLGFVPLGKETVVNLQSGWQDPGFSGSFLPDERSVGRNGFTATYRILELNRNYPQFWLGNQHSNSIHGSAFGVDLLLPVNDYQKSMRAAKYALLAITLTFLTFFLFEILNRKKVHPFQYTLIGLALVLFYTLLISVSEHTNFNIAYLVAGGAVILMTGLYAGSILKSMKQTLLFVFILFLTYSFVFMTLQIQEYALLTGSIGLTLILALTMFVTRKINWYELSSIKNG